MDEDIQNFGSNLKKFVSIGEVVEANNFLQRIDHLFDNENLSSSARDFMISNIFGKPKVYGIFDFIDNLIQDHIKWKNTISVALRMIENLFKKYSRFMRSYFNITLINCMKYARSGIDSYGKERALVVMCIILEEGYVLNIQFDDIKFVYDKYLIYLKTTDPKALTGGTVLKNVFILLGIIAKNSPEVISDEKELLKLFLRNISNIKVGDKGATSKIFGAFKGLSNLLVPFDHLLEEDEKRCKQLYEVVKKCIDSKWLDLVEEKNKGRIHECRSAVEFISKHTLVINKCMPLNDINWWHKTFKRWYESDNVDNKKAGFQALLEFYKALDEIFRSNSEDESYVNEFEVFYKDFDEFEYTSLRVKNPAIRLSLHGKGVLAKAFKELRSSDELKDVLYSIMDTMETLYLKNEEIHENDLEYLPDYIKCCSAIISELDDINYDQFDTLQQCSILMVKEFPKISNIYHNLVIESLRLTFLNLHKKGNIKLFNMFTETFVYKSLIWSCSYPIEYLDDTKSINYKDFIPLWKKIISLNTGNSNIDSADLKEVVKQIFNEIIKNLFIFTTKLNLNIITEEKENQITQKPENIDDYTTFLNMVEIFKELLTPENVQLFRSWIKKFAKHVIKKSLTSPIISGYYKLLSYCLKLSDCCNYFENLEQNEDKYLYYQMISQFLEGVISKVHQFTGELQMSCLTLILEAPSCFIKNLLPIMAPVFQVTFSFGLSYLTIAETGIETLEKWYQHFEPNELKPLLKTVLPYLDPFLRSRGFTGDTDIKSPFTKPKRRKIQFKQHYETESELLKLQKKILIFIGQLNTDVSLYLIQNNINVETVPWEIKPSLDFIIPFEDVKANIYLDKIILRVIELALHSGDRKSRISACEILHGTFVVLLTKSIHMPDQNQYKYTFKKLFKTIIVPVITLGCDSDEIVKQIFENFVYQLIHWYTSPSKLMSFESEILIDTLMEGVSHPTNTNLREFSGKCINEYVDWSIKQYKHEDHVRIYENIKTIVQKICSYCQHPNSNKRYGAALAFNNIYRKLREEQSMVDRFWIELLYKFILNLNMKTEKINKERNCIEISKTITHIERVFKEEKTLFNQCGYKRKVPENIKGPLLKDVVIWILQNTGSNNPECRQKCMNLFLTLAPCVENKTPKEFLEKHQNPQWYIEIYEKNFNNYTTDNYKDLIEFLNNILCSLEGYLWILDKKLLTFNEIKTEKLFTILNIYISNISKTSLSNILPESPMDTEVFNELKCETTQKLFDLTIKIVENNPEHPFLNNNLWDLFKICLFEPQEAGFNVINNLDMDKLTKNNINLLNKFCNLPERYLNDLTNVLSNYFNDKYQSDISLEDRQVPNNQRQLLKGLIMIQKSKLQKLNINKTPWSIKKIFESIIKEDEGLSLTGPVFSYLELQLEIALGNKNTELWDCLIERKDMIEIDTFASWKSGDYFFHKFKNILLPYLSINAGEVVKNYFKIPKIPSIENGGDILMEIFKYLSQNRRNIKIDYTILITEVMKSCENYFVFSKMMNLKDREFQVEFLTHIAKLSQSNEPLYTLSVNFSFLTNWYILSLLLSTEEDSSNVDSIRSVMEFKIKLLSLLPCFTGPNDDNNGPLLNELQQNRNPNNIIDLRSTLKQFLQTTVNILTAPRSKIVSHIDTDAALSNLFNKWLSVLHISKSRLVLECVAELYMKLKNKDIVSKLDEKIKIYFQKMNITQEYKSIDLILSLVLNKEDYDRTEQYNLGKIFLPLMLRHCSYDCFQEFYLRYITEIIQTNNKKVEDNKNAEFIIKKSIYFVLLETLFSRINVTKLNDKSCIINKQLTDASNKDGLLKSASSALLEVRKESYEPDPDTKEMYRIYHCNALNALISLISNTKKESIFYFNFFFKLSDQKMWENIINSEIINFPIDFDTIPAMRKVFINIRKENTKTETTYIKSQILCSTLSEDVFKYDFTNLNLRSQNEINSNEYNYQQLEFDSVDINNHECMATFCGLIQHMIDNISPLPKNDDVPKWVETIQKILLNDETKKNIKIFFARLIFNMNDIFKHFAKHFYVPIIKVITDNCGGQCINYFVTDLLQMIIKWTDATILQNEKAYVIKLVEFLMNYAHSERKDALKFNIEIIKTIFDLWKEYISLDGCLPESLNLLLLNKLKSQKNTAIQLLGIVLANKIMPWNKTNIDKYISVFNSIYAEKTDHKSLSEVIGLSLCILEENKWISELTTFEKRIKGILSAKTESKTKGTQELKFLQCLEHIQLHYPKIITEFIKRIYKELMNNIKNPGVVTICLKNILRHITTTKKIYPFEEKDLKDFKDLKDLLNNHDEDIQILTLQIINKIIELSDNRDILNLLNKITEFKTSTNIHVREAMYDIFITIHKKSSVEDLLKKSRSVLISGLIDTDLDLQNKIQKFWTDKELLPSKLSERYKKLLTNFYSSDTELYYLGYSVYFLLEGCKESTDYQKMLHEYPLKDCKYEKYDLIDTKSRYNSLTPLFFDSYASQFGNITQLQGVRNTNTLKYAETQSNVYNSTQTTSSFLFKTNLTLSSDLIDEKYITTEEKVKEKTVVRPSGRFLKDKVQIKKYFAKREVDRNIKREEFKRLRIKNRDAAISIYRDYKKGEFPDVQIMYSEIIKPLQALSRRDGTIARHLYVMLFKGLISKMEKDYSIQYLKDIDSYITNIFEDTISFEPKLISAFFDLYLDYKEYITINPDRLVTLSKNTGLLSTGCLLLEEQIMNECQVNETKRGVASQNSTEYQWAKLADVYKEGNDWDAVIGIFSKNEAIEFPKKELILQAVLEEATNSWKKASDNYKELFDIDPSTARKDFYYDSCYKCYAHLSDWDKMLNEINEEINFDKFIEGDKFEESILPWFFTAGVYVTLEKQENTHLLQFLHNSMIDGDKSKYIINKFSEELSVLSLINNDIAASNYYIENYLSIFLSDWSNIIPLYIKTRANKLINLQKIVDIKKFLTFTNNINESNAENKLSDIIKYCNKYNDMATPSFIVSEMKTMYRKYIIKQVEDTYLKFSDLDNTELQNITLNAKFSFINYALNENNYSVAQKYIKKCNLTPAQGADGIKLSLLRCRSVLIQSEDLSLENKVKELTRWWRHLDLAIKNNKNHTNLLIESTLLAHKYSTLINNINHDQIDIKEFLKDLFTTKVIKNDVNPNLLQYSVDILRYGIQIGEKDTNKINKHKQDLSDAYMNLVLYLQKQNTNKYNDEIIKYVLRAMKFGNEEARQLFPCILEILRISKEQHEQLFKTESSEVPTWMFITWIPQLLAFINTSSARVVENILLKLVESYPQAIMYPYQLSKEKFDTNTQIIKKMDRILTNPSLENFISAISSVCVPELNLNYHVQSMLSTKNETELKTAVNNFLNDVYKKANSVKSLDALAGIVFESLKLTCETIANSSLNVLKEKLIEPEMQDMLKLGSNKIYRPYLKDYSPWLANFQTTKGDFDFEIPGQYSGDRKPLIQHHVKISSFSENVKVFKSSIRKPIKITMLGNDSKEYEFFVKFGEDLRQDQRIQQLFKIANTILEKDVACSQRNLSIETYNVIPLKHNVGLIQNVSDTKSFKEFIFGVLEEGEQKKCAGIREKYVKWIMSAPKIKIEDNKLSSFYNNSCMAYNRDEVVCKFKALTNEVPWDILRKSFWSISMDVESFIFLRQQFITSYSTMCIIHWILGISDRHLDNILISQKSGRAVGIDFGYAFDMGTRNFPIPELMPFRLTPHILYLIEPLKEKGFIELSMVHCLKALRKQKHILLSAMDVFVNEPSIGWIEIAQNRAQEKEIDIYDSFVPSEKISNAKKKLEGINPMKITIQELNQGALRNDKDYLKAYLRVVKGDNNERKNVKDEGLTVEEQVLCLVEQATDENILGRAYVGFEPWI